jgi:hypothetical protein
MPDESKEITRIDLQPEEIIRTVKTRFRVCRYLFNTGACWFAACGIASILDLLGRYYAPKVVEPEIITTFLMISLAIVSVGVAVAFAIFRCPVCDIFLGSHRLQRYDLEDNLLCPGCKTRVK